MFRFHGWVTKTCHNVAYRRLLIVRRLESYSHVVNISDPYLENRVRYGKECCHTVRQCHQLRAVIRAMDTIV